MVGSNTIHCARADTVMPSVTSASAMNLFMVCLSLCCRCRRQHAANHEKGFTTERTRCGVSGAQDSKKSVKRNANGHFSVQDTSAERIGYGLVKTTPTTASTTMGFTQSRISAVLPATKIVSKSLLTILPE